MNRLRVLLDSGPLVLLIYSLGRPDLIGTGKTKMHSKEMGAKLIDEISGANEHISMPNILSEASNHLGAGRQEAFPSAAIGLANYISGLSEIYRPSKELVLLPEYSQVGLSDCAIISCVPQLVQERISVFTQDHELFGRLCD